MAAVIYNFSGGGSIRLSGLTVSNIRAGSRVAAELTATNVTSAVTNALDFFDYYVNLYGVVTNSQGAVVMTMVAVPVGIGPNPPAIPRDGFVGISMQTSQTVPSNLGGQRVTVYVGPQSSFNGAIVGALYTGGASVTSASAVVLGTSSGSGSTGGSTSGGGSGSTPGSFGNAPTPPPTKTTTSTGSKLGQYAAIGVGVLGLLVVGWGAWDLELHKAGATRIVVNDPSR